MTPSDDIGVADWIREVLHPFARDVGSVIPPGFDAYARIFHPATLQRRTLADAEVEMRWSEVAAASRRTVHPEMQFDSIAAAARGRQPARLLRVHPPRTGVLSPQQMEALVPLLARQTSTVDRCWFCLWDGYGYLHGGGAYYQFAFRRRWWQGISIRRREPPPRRRLPPPLPEMGQARPRVQLPHRDYLLFAGSVDQAHGWEHGPNLWWPDDRAWCVASEIDFPYTYVGGAADLIAEIVAHPSLEALPATLADGITADSDKVNS
jgi:hypothetical protein